MKEELVKYLPEHTATFFMIICVSHKTKIFRKLLQRGIPTACVH
jgi:hypothetical protein